MTFTYRSSTNSPLDPVPVTRSLTVPPGLTLRNHRSRCLPLSRDEQGRRIRGEDLPAGCELIVRYPSSFIFGSGSVITDVSDPGGCDDDGSLLRSPRQKRAKR